MGSAEERQGLGAPVELNSMTVGTLMAHRLRQDAHRGAYAEHGQVFAGVDGNPAAAGRADKAVQ
jgi:hypothetical protein